MRTELHRVQSDCYKLLLSTEGKKEESLELVVPDRCGDIDRILDVRGQLFMTSKRIREGEALICSRAEFCVLFAAESSGEIEYVSAHIPIEQSFSLGTTDEDCELVAQIQLAGLDAKALNPRKLLLRAECACQLRCFVKGSFALCDGFGEGCAAPAHIKRCQLNHSLVTDVREKTFTISDEYSLPAKYAGAKMLTAETRLSVNDSKPVGSKLVLKATASTCAVFLNPEDDSVFKFDFASQFSQIIEIAAGEGSECMVFAALKETEFISLPERETPCFSMRLTMSAQALCAQSIVSNYVSDAYSTQFDIGFDNAQEAFSVIGTAQRQRMLLKGRMPLGGSSDGIIYLAPASLSCRSEDSRLLSTALLTGIMNGDEGEALPLRLTISSEEQIEAAEGQKLQLLDVSCEPASIEPGGEVSLAVTAEYCMSREGSINALRAIEYDESSPCKSDQPSLVVLLSPGEQDTWTLAKKYRSTEELICAANCDGDDFSVNRRPLIIPRA